MGVTPVIALKMTRDHDILHTNVPVGTVVTTRLPRVANAYYSTVIWITSINEPAVISHQFRENFYCLPFIIFSARMNKPPDDAGQHWWLRMSTCSWVGIGIPDRRPGKIISVIVTKNDVRDHAVLPLCIE